MKKINDLKDGDLLWFRLTEYLRRENDGFIAQIK